MQPPNTGTSAVLAGNVGIGTTSPTTAGLVIATNVSGVALDVNSSRIANVAAPINSTDE